MRKSIVALEAIGFQDTGFFKELTQAVFEVRSVYADAKGMDKAKIKAFYESAEMKGILDVIRKHTNLTFIYGSIEYPAAGPSVVPPLLSKSHLLMEDLWTNQEWLQKDAKELMGRLKTQELRGSVDLRNNKVSGVYKELKIALYLPVNVFARKGLTVMGSLTANPYVDFSDAELAAIILHEVGHAFTYLELLSRTASTNLCLSALARAKALDEEDKDAHVYETVLRSYATQAGLSKNQTQALENTTSLKQATVVLYDISVEKSQSELGNSVYDNVGREFIADQYATRCGAGRDLVIGLEKIRALGDPDAGRNFNQVINLSLLTVIMLTSVVGAGIAGLITYLIIADQSKGGDYYDNDHIRVRRIRHDLIEKLKNVKMGDADKNECLEAVDEIATVLESIPEADLTVYERIAKFVRPGFRKDHNYEILQKQLEQLASNELFVKAAKLSTL